MYQKAIALGADLHYLDKVETVIKSVSVHNHEVKFYVFNDDLPSEWFLLMRNRLKVIGSEIVNVKKTDHNLRDFHLPNAILSYAAFFRYFIADEVQEDRVLYLDSDTIVNAKLDDLFTLDLQGYAIAAVQDFNHEGWLTTFNSGVMLIDAKKWRAKNSTQSLLELTAQHHEHVYGDQGVLNMYFGDQWLHLDKEYNFMVGLDQFLHLSGNKEWYQSDYYGNYEPKIIHYTSESKPWTHMTLTRFRKLWWFYYGLNWNDVLLSSDITKRSFNELVGAPLYHTCIFTNSAAMESLEYLLSELPEVHFTILAHTNFAPFVVDFQSHLNLSLFPNFNPFNMKETLDKMDFYLDINHEGEIANIIEEVQKRDKPIFTFDNTSHDSSGRSRVFSSAEPDKMVEAIRKFLGEELNGK
ncbi:glycosyltransferase family 8 protein [Streptococcus sp. HMSC071D03]|uniref:glycosyltransferase family 8 protein n=1 Tax=Streptococcus sp. HMSC071D03 TaxID=1739341 RepID=UPI0009F375E3|nr:glycosyltransferase family 8 protein [Streptococcus sp. HMSC071D03]